MAVVEHREALRDHDLQFQDKQHTTHTDRTENIVCQNMERRFANTYLQWDKKTLSVLSEGSMYWIYMARLMTDSAHRVALGPGH